MREITFSPARALESTIYLAERLKNPTMHEILKLRYFADKIHLSKYGFLASGDNYCALEFGPVASNTYNMLRAARGDRSAWINDALGAFTEGSLIIENSMFVKVNREANLELLAGSDIECLNEAISAWGGMSFQDRTMLSHDSAYNAAWDTAKAAKQRFAEMDLQEIVRTLDNADEILESLAA